ncbi:hypothetical protein BDZ89DRAFT_544617 [Hymenopellis radicata]|nr:hypothetical protein BDZ89DRAFT_544617 [Hymenopellis radicata]
MRCDQCMSFVHSPSHFLPSSLLCRRRLIILIHSFGPWPLVLTDMAPLCVHCGYFYMGRLKSGPGAMSMWRTRLRDILLSV